jgi:hypothetical protein
MKRTAPEICPACGAEVPPRALACPECGADEKTGWNEEATQYDGLDLPVEFADHEEASRNNSTRQRAWLNGLPWYWWLLAIILLASFGYAILTGRW